jgi:uncharacterized membrane protein
MDYRKKMIMAVMIIVAVVMLLGCTVTTTYTATFHVLDATSAPVQEATISINGGTLTTDVNGNAVFTAPAGTYSYTVAKDGYNTFTSDATTSVTLPTAATVDVTLSSIQSSKQK